MQTGADRILTIPPGDDRLETFEGALLRPVLRGRDVRRYRTSVSPKLLIFPYKRRAAEFRILTEEELSGYTEIHRYLQHNRKELEHRVWFGKSAEDLSGEWYGLMYLDRPAAFSSAHLLTPRLSDRSNFTVGQGNLFATGTAGVTSVIPSGDLEEDMLYLLGLLNSSALSFYLVSHSPMFSGRYFKFSAPYLKKLPIRTIDFSNPAEVEKHDRMVALVERMLDLHKRLQEANTPDAKTRLQRQIAATDKEIDQLVYDLYELTDDEIRIVEGGDV